MRGFPACALLDGTDGEKHVHSLHASLGIAQAGNPRMACVEHQVLEIVTQIQNFGFIALSELLGISDKIIQLFSNHLF